MLLMRVRCDCEHEEQQRGAPSKKSGAEHQKQSTIPPGTVPAQPEPTEAKRQDKAANKGEKPHRWIEKITAHLRASLSVSLVQRVPL